MASIQRRDWVGVLALILGSVLLLLGGLFVLIYVAGLLTGDSEVTDNVSGFVMVTAITVGPGILLVRRSRRDRRDGSSPPPAEEDVLVELRHSERSNRAGYWRHVGIGSAIAVAVIIVVGVATAAFDLRPAVPGLVAAGGAGLAIWVLSNRGSKPAEHIAAEVRFEDTTVRFSNIAFSDRRPTMFGWKRDVGILTVNPDSIVLEGLSGRQIVISAPYAAELHSERFMHWMMVRLTGGESGHRTTVYLVVRGAPRSKFAANPQDIILESSELVRAINDTSLPST